MEKLLKIINRKKDCVLVQTLRNKLYKVIDIEQDTICITESYELAKRVFSKYDLETVRNQREEAFNEWLSEIAEE